MTAIFLFIVVVGLMSVYRGIWAAIKFFLLMLLWIAVFIGGIALALYGRLLYDVLEHTPENHRLELIVGFTGLAIAALVIPIAAFSLASALARMLRDLFV
jgi:hypothetical protein